MGRMGDMIVLLVLALVVLILPAVLTSIILVKISKLREELRRYGLGIAAPPHSQSVSPKETLPDNNLPPIPEPLSPPEERAVEPLSVAPGPESCTPSPIEESVDTPSTSQDLPSQSEAGSAFEMFLTKIGNWITVSGEFAPKGVTHEFAVATRWLVRVGAVLIAASLVYFVKLSIDMGWMGPAGRVASSVLYGAASSLCGVYLVRRTHYGIVGHALAALGVVALYVGFGLGHRYFEPPVIASTAFAFAALFGATLYAGAAAVLMPSPFIAVMAVSGGYLVPLLAGRDSGSPTALCAYLLLIDAMAFWVARFRHWSALDFLSATVAYAIVFVWCGMHSHLESGKVLVVFSFFTVVHFIYMLGVVVDSGRRSKPGNAIAWSGLALNACAYCVYITTGFRSAFSDRASGFILFALVAAYLAVAAYGKRRGTVDAATINITLVFSLAFLGIAPFLICGKAWWPVLWCAIAVAASEAEAYTRQRILGVLALIIFAAAAIFGSLHLAPECYDAVRANSLWSAGTKSYWVDLLLRVVRLWTIPVSCALIGRRSRSWLYGVACVIGFVFYSCEAHLFGVRFLPACGGGIVTVAWALLAFAGIWMGIARRLRVFRTCSLVLLGGVVIKLLFIDTAQLSTTPRVAIFALCGILLIVGAVLYIKFKERFADCETEK